jgi:methionine synthase II (cobalamin-independent)
MPGADPREAVRTVVGEVADFVHVPELPARGPGADMVGRTAGILVDLHVDRQPSGWRLVGRAGRDERRAASWLGEDLDAVEELAAGYSGPLKTQLVGPCTLAAEVELPRGDKAVGDPGARRDLAASLAEAVTVHLADLRRRVPAARPVLQLDEPGLPAVLAGRVPTASGLRTLRAVQPGEATGLLRVVLDAARDAGARTVVHCCAADVPIGLLRAAGADGVSLDLALALASPATTADELLGTAVEEGGSLLLGLVPSSGSPTGLSDAAGTVAPVRAMRRRLGLDPELLSAAVVVTPTCGLAGASPAYARAALAACRAAGRLLLDDPEG